MAIGANRVPCMRRGRSPYPEPLHACAHWMCLQIKIVAKSKSKTASTQLTSLTHHPQPSARGTPIDVFNTNNSRSSSSPIYLPMLLLYAHRLHTHHKRYPHTRTPPFTQNLYTLSTPSSTSNNIMYYKIFVINFPGTICSGVFCLCLGIPRFSQHDGVRARIGSFVINTIVGVAQAFTLIFCLVGWGWSIWWGMIMLRASSNYKCNLFNFSHLSASVCFAFANCSVAVQCTRTRSHQRLYSLYGIHGRWWIFLSRSPYVFTSGTRI